LFTTLQQHTNKITTIFSPTPQKHTFPTAFPKYPAIPLAKRLINDFMVFFGPWDTDFVQARGKSAAFFVDKTYTNEQGIRPNK